MSPAEDLKSHCQFSQQLLNHYFAVLEDRKVYYTARERGKTFKDVLVLIIDSYDKAKVTLPRWPFQRCPKRPIYEQVRRSLSANNLIFYF